MRVTANTFPDSLLNHLTHLASRQARLQNQAATGQRIQLPEDDPAAMRRVLDLQAESKSNLQYQRNIERHQELAGATYDSIKSLKKISDRAGEIATLADGLKSPQELAIFSKEVSELIKQAVQVANTKNRGDFLFAGTLSDQPPFVLESAADGKATAVSYQGNTAVAGSEIAAGVAFSVQAPGANSSGSGPRGLIADSRTGADFFNHLIALQNHLATGDTEAIADTDRAALAADEENLILQMGTNGAQQARLETTAAMGSRRHLAIESLVSNEADSDIAETIVKLQQTQTAYQAALQSAGSILGRSLLDYLR